MRFSDLRATIERVVQDTEEEAVGDTFCACGHLAKFHGSMRKTRCLIQRCYCRVFADAGPLCKCGEPRVAHKDGLSTCEKVDCNCERFWDPASGAATSLTRVHRARLVHPDDLDVCGFCGEGGAEKIPAPLQYRDQMDAETSYVHQECEREEEERCAQIEWDRRRQEGEPPPVGP